jgi:hypothetical protein
MNAASAVTRCILGAIMAVTINLMMYLPLAIIVMIILSLIVQSLLNSSYTQDVPMR